MYLCGNGRLTLCLVKISEYELKQYIFIKSFKNIIEVTVKIKRKKGYCVTKVNSLYLIKLYRLYMYDIDVILAYYFQ